MVGDSGVAMKKKPDTQAQLTSFEEFEARAKQNGYTVNKVIVDSPGTMLMFANSIDKEYGEDIVHTGKRPQVVEAGIGGTATGVVTGLIMMGAGVGLEKWGLRVKEVPVSDAQGRQSFVKGPAGDDIPVTREVPGKWVRRGMRMGGGMLFAMGALDVLNDFGIDNQKLNMVLPPACVIIFGYEKTGKLFVATVSKAAGSVGKKVGAAKPIRETGEFLGKAGDIWSSRATLEAKVATSAKEWAQISENIGMTFVDPVRASLGTTVKSAVDAAQAGEAQAAANDLLEKINNELKKGGMELNDPRGQVRAYVEEQMKLKNVSPEIRIGRITQSINSALPKEVPFGFLFSEGREAFMEKLNTDYAGMSFREGLAQFLFERGRINVENVDAAKALIPENVEDLESKLKSRPSRIGTTLKEWKVAPRSAQVITGAAGLAVLGAVGYYGYEKIAEKSGRHTEAPVKPAQAGKGGAQTQQQQKAQPTLSPEEQRAKWAQDEVARSAGMKEWLAQKGIGAADVIIPEARVSASSGEAWKPGTLYGWNDLAPIELGPGKTAVCMRFTIGKGSDLNAQTRQLAYLFQTKMGNDYKSDKGWDDFYPKTMPGITAEVVQNAAVISFTPIKKGSERRASDFKPALGESFDLVVVFDKGAGTWEAYAATGTDGLKLYASGALDKSMKTFDAAIGVARTSSDQALPSQKITCTMSVPIQ